MFPYRLLAPEFLTADLPFRASFLTCRKRLRNLVLSFDRHEGRMNAISRWTTAIMYNDMSIFSRPSLRRGLFIFAAALFILAFLRTSYYSYGKPQAEAPMGMGSEAKEPAEKAFVVASMQRDDVAWIHEHLPDWELNRYVVDDQSAKLTVPKNKGREAMVYLTFVQKLPLFNLD
jgi:hypothetical protein